MENKRNIIYLLGFLIPLTNTSEMFPTNNKHNVEKNNKKKKKKNDSELLTSLHFQCDTFFQHTLNFTFSSFNKKTDTTYF